MTANTEVPPRLHIVSVRIPADRYPEIVRKVAAIQTRTGKPVTIGAWARDILLDAAA